MMKSSSQKHKERGQHWHSWPVELEIKVTHIANRYHARLYHGTNIVDEMACVDQRDIGYICREMLRWYDKLGGNSAYAKTARRRQTNQVHDRIWYHSNLDLEQIK